MLINSYRVSWRILENHQTWGILVILQSCILYQSRDREDPRGVGRKNHTWSFRLANNWSSICACSEKRCSFLIHKIYKKIKPWPRIHSPCTWFCAWIRGCPQGRRRPRCNSRWWTRRESCPLSDTLRRCIWRGWPRRCTGSRPSSLPTNLSRTSLNILSM